MVKGFFKKINLFKTYISVFAGLLMFSFAFFVSAQDSVSNSNIFQDTDQDGLLNEEERLYGTDPSKSDTDHDGYSDGVEVKSGYDPLKPAPGDKIVKQESQNEGSNDSDVTGTDPAEKNLTQELAKQVAATLKEGEVSGENISLEDFQGSIQKVLDENSTVDTFPEVDEKSIKIKKQNYRGLAEADRNERIKSDTTEYVTEVAYIFVSNSPLSVQTTDDIGKIAGTASSQAMSVLSGGNMALMSDFFEKGSKIQSQLSDIEVPENMLEMHKKALQIAVITTALKDQLVSSANDPLASLAVLTKTQALIGVTMNFMTEMQMILAKYGIQDIPVQL